MPRRTLPLTDKEIKNAKYKDKAYCLYDGGGLFLLVTPEKIVRNKTVPGSKLWRLKYRLNDEERLMSLGDLEDVSLEQARKKRQDTKDKVKVGIDPIKEKKEVKATIVAATEHTLEKIGREWHKNFASLWSENYGSQKLIRLEKEIFPYLGSTPVTELTGPDLLTSLRRIESRGNLDLAHRMLYDVRKILTYAIATGRATRNIAADISGSLPPVHYGNRAAVTKPADIARLMKSLHVYWGHPLVCAALKLAPLVFARPGELRSMSWCEIDLKEGLWDVPAEKMKMKNAHYVPLSRQAIAILEDVKPLSRGGLVFPSVRFDQNNRTLSENTLNCAIRLLGFAKEEMCSHGFRAMARTAAREQLKINAEYLEIQLAHMTKAPNGTAYDRVQFLPERIVVMQQWADYLDQLRLS